MPAGRRGKRGRRGRSVTLAGMPGVDREFREVVGAFATRGVLSIGRYGRWHFQGIVDSVREGLDVPTRIGAR